MKSTALEGGERRIPELDGIRACAILAVLLTHGFSSPAIVRAAATWHGVPKALYAVVEHGWLGVDLFFVLSGFLITGILLDTRTRRTYFRDFWVRRGLRILPLVLAVVAIITVVYKPQAALVVMALFFAVDFAPLFGLGNHAMGPLWSLAVEEQFYLVWPLLVFFLRGRTLAVVTVAVVVAEPIIRALTFGGLLDVLWCRVDGLAVGALVAIFIRSRWYSRATTARLAAAALAVAGVLAVVSLHGERVSYAFRITQADLVFGAAIALAVAFSGSAAFALLRTRTARFIADTSFCAYLIHVPLLDLARFCGIGTTVANPVLAATLQAAFAFPLTFAIAALSRRYYELPFQRLKNRFAPTRRSATEAA